MTGDSMEHYLTDDCDVCVSITVSLRRENIGFLHISAPSPAVDYRVRYEIDLPGYKLLIANG